MVESIIQPKNGHHCRHLPAATTEGAAMPDEGRDTGPGMVHIVGVGPGPVDLLTLRALDRIQRAEVVMHDPLVSPEVLTLIQPQAERIQVGPASGQDATTQAQIHAQLIEQARRGRRVVRLKSGDPHLFGCGGEEIEALQAAGLAFEVVPAAAPVRPAQEEATASSGEQFSAADRSSLYRVIAARRDMRHFAPGAHLDDAVLQRLLQAAHHAPSVGLMQPWRFVRICDPGLRERMAGLVDGERRATASALGARSAEFLRLKVEGLRDCAELLAVVLAPDDGTVFGRRTLPTEMVLCSVGCAIENLWLAAQAENLGLGWVSMFDPEALGCLLGLPEGARALGVLCLGPVKRFYDAPMLELEGWRRGRPLADMLFFNQWGQQIP